MWWEELRFGCVFCNRFRVVVGHVNGNWTGQNTWYATDGNNNGGGCWVVRQEQWRVKQKEQDIQQLFLITYCKSSSEKSLPNFL